MEAVFKKSAYPATVKAGIPRLDPCPPSWTQAPIGSFVDVVKRPAKLIDDQEYDLVTVKRARGGAEKRETKKGGQISVKTQFYVEEGDFLISKRQIVHGACAVVPKNISGSVVSNEYAVLRPNDKLDLVYLRYLSNMGYFQRTCFHSSIGVHVEKMIFKLDQWLGWPFNIPPIEEQRKIVKALSIWEDAISETEALIDNSKIQKKAIMQQLLTGKKRLPNFVSKWNNVSISEMGVCISGGTPKSDRKEYWGGDLLWATPTDITGLKSKYISQTSRKITKEGLLSSSAKVLPIGSLIICTRATIGHMAIAKVPIATNQGFKNLTPGPNFHAEFLFHLFTFFKNKFVRYACGSTFLELSKKDFQKLCFNVPLLDEQKAIAAVLDRHDEFTEKLKQNYDRLSSEKVALLRQLLTGKRLVEIG